MKFFLTYYFISFTLLFLVYLPYLIIFVNCKHAVEVKLHSHTRFILYAFLFSTCLCFTCFSPGISLTNLNLAYNRANRVRLRYSASFTYRCLYHFVSSYFNLVTVYAILHLKTYYIKNYVNPES